jgi:hypothetical protein
MIDPSPRTSILAALDDPTSVLNITTDEYNLPDICQLYQTYQSAGRMINLADWFQAFSQSVQGSSTSTTTASNKRKRGEEEDQPKEKREVIQARFALAVCELGRMGFLKRTRRKPDHVLKIVHDLPPSR